MVTVKITETYDLKTTVNKMGLLGIHTPTVTLLRRLYPGLLKNHKFVRFLKADVVGACASVLPADPLQVGVSAGSVAPEDLFNPILYKAVTNQSFDTLVNRITDPATQTLLGSMNGDNVSISSSATQFAIYYSLLAENGEFRKAMPQSGFAIKNLVPICHTLVSNYGNVGPIQTANVMDYEENAYDVPDLSTVPHTGGALASTVDKSTAMVFRGKSVKMPKLPIHTGLESWDAIPEPSFVKTMVAMLVIPPARLHEFYYRVRITWTVQFLDICTTNSMSNGSDISINGSAGYLKTYNYTKSENELDQSETMVDATNVDIEKIMES